MLGVGGAILSILRTIYPTRHDTIDVEGTIDAQVLSARTDAALLTSLL